MSSINVKKTRTFNKQPSSTTKNVNPYLNMNQINYNSNDLQATLPSIQEKDKAKMGKSMQRRMSINQSVDLSKLMKKDGTIPALPSGILEQYQTKPPLSSGSGTIRSQQVYPDHQARNYTEDPQQPRPHPQKTSSAAKGLLDLDDSSIIQLLADPEFNAELFISSRLSESTASDIETFNSNLASLNHKIVNDIKSTSVQTYQRLLKTSKELQSTDEELKFLRNAINELFEVTNTMRETAEKKIQWELEQTNDLTKSNTIKRQKKRVDRSSILLLEKIWSSEMSSLFKHVEGAQKFIAAIPGRHIIVESGRWFELNAVTFKSLQPAHIFLLNDLILIATRRRKAHKPQIDSKNSQSLVADQCWPLREVSLVQLQPNSGNNEETSYAINITYNSLSYIYQTDRYDHYQKIINGFKKARDELRDISEAENIKQKQLRDSMNLLTISENSNRSSVQGKRQSLHKRQSSNTGLLQDLSSKIHSRSRSIDNTSILRNLKKIDENVDDIEVLIFHENHRDSIKKLKDLEIELNVYEESCTPEELLVHKVVSLKISNKLNEILRKLINSFKTDNLSNTKITDLVNNLIELGQIDVAKTLFLNNRSSHTKQLIKNVIESQDFEGRPKLYQYLIEISIVKFQNLKLVIDLYNQLFTKYDSKSLSYLVNWGTNEVIDHINELKKLLNNVKLTKQQLENSILLLYRQTNELKDAGLDVEYLMQEFYRSINAE